MKKSTAILLCCGTALVGLLICLVVLFVPKKDEQEPVVEPTVESIEESVSEPEPEVPITTEQPSIPNVDPEIDLSQLETPTVVWNVEIPAEFGDFFQSEEAVTAITNVYPGAKDIVVTECGGNPDFSVNFKIENSTSSIVFYSAGEGTFGSPVIINNSGTDYAPIIFTNGIPENVEDIYEASLDYEVFSNFIYYTDYTGGSTVTLTSNVGTSVTIEL